MSRAAYSAIAFHTLGQTGLCAERDLVAAGSRWGDDDRLDAERRTAGLAIAGGCVGSSEQRPHRVSDRQWTRVLRAGVLTFRARAPVSPFSSRVSRWQQRAPPFVSRAADSTRPEATRASRGAGPTTHPSRRKRQPSPSSRRSLRSDRHSTRSSSIADRTSCPRSSRPSARNSVRAPRTYIRVIANRTSWPHSTLHRRCMRVPRRGSTRP